MGKDPQVATLVVNSKRSSGIDCIDSSILARHFRVQRRDLRTSRFHRKSIQRTKATNNPSRSVWIHWNPLESSGIHPIIPSNTISSSKSQQFYSFISFIFIPPPWLGFYEILLRFFWILFWYFEGPCRPLHGFLGIPDDLGDSLGCSRYKQGPLKRNKSFEWIAARKYGRGVITS